MSLVVYSKADGGYTVTTGNVISAANIEDLKKRLMRSIILKQERSEMFTGRC